MFTLFYAVPTNQRPVFKGKNVSRNIPVTVKLPKTEKGLSKSSAQETEIFTKPEKPSVFSEGMSRPWRQWDTSQIVRETWHLDGVHHSRREGWRRDWTMPGSSDYGTDINWLVECAMLSCRLVTHLHVAVRFVFAQILKEKSFLCML